MGSCAFHHKRVPSQARSVYRVPYPQRLPRVATISHPATSDHLATTRWRNKMRPGVLRLFVSLGAHSKVTQLHCPVALPTLTSQSTTCMLETTACLRWTSTLAVHKHHRTPSHTTNVSLRPTHVVQLHIHPSTSPSNLGQYATQLPCDLSQAKPKQTRTNQNTHTPRHTLLHHSQAAICTKRSSTAHTIKHSLRC